MGMTPFKNEKDWQERKTHLPIGNVVHIFFLLFFLKRMRLISFLVVFFNSSKASFPY